MNQKTKTLHSVKSFNWNLPNKKHRNCGFPGTNYFQSFFSPVSIYHFVRNLANVVEEDFCQLNHPEPKPKTHTASQEGQELGEPELWERVARHENLEIGFEDTGMVFIEYHLFGEHKVYHRELVPLTTRVKCWEMSWKRKQDHRKWMKDRFSNIQLKLKGHLHQGVQ